MKPDIKSRANIRSLLSLVTVTTWMLWLPVLDLRTLMSVIMTLILVSVRGVWVMFLTSGMVFRSSC